MALDITGKRVEAQPLDKNRRAIAGIVLPIVDINGNITGWAPIASVDQGDGTLALKVDTELEIGSATFIISNVKVGSTDQTSLNVRYLRTLDDGTVVVDEALDDKLKIFEQTIAAVSATVFNVKADMDTKFSVNNSVVKFLRYTADRATTIAINGDSETISLSAGEIFIINDFNITTFTVNTTIVNTAIKISAGGK